MQKNLWLGVNKDILHVEKPVVGGKQGYASNKKLWLGVGQDLLPGKKQWLWVSKGLLPVKNSGWG